MDVKAELLKRSQAPLSKGELVILAKVISDRIPLFLDGSFDVKYQVLNYKRSIQNVQFFLNNYTFFDQATEEHLFRLIEQFLNWRYSIAFKPADPLFVAGSNFLIDELSLLPRFLDVNDLVSICDMYSNANYTYNLFKSVIEMPEFLIRPNSQS